MSLRHVVTAAVVRDSVKGSDTMPRAVAVAGFVQADLKGHAVMFSAVPVTA